MQQPLVSVIIPVKNGLPHFRRVLDMLQKQDLDGGSSLNFVFPLSIAVDRLFFTKDAMVDRLWRNSSSAKALHRFNEAKRWLSRKSRRPICRYALQRFMRQGVCRVHWSNTRTKLPCGRAWVFAAVHCALNESPSVTGRCGSGRKISSQAI